LGQLVQLVEYLGICNQNIRNRSPGAPVIEKLYELDPKPSELIMSKLEGAFKYSEDCTHAMWQNAGMTCN